MRILLTTTSYQDTPGPHHDLLEASGFEVVRARGPLSESKLLELIESPPFPPTPPRSESGGGASGGAEEGPGFDGILNGDDQITARVINAALDQPHPLKVIAKYGIGLDSIDVEHATRKRLPVLFTPGVNHTTVAEHAFGLMIALSKHFWPHLRAVKSGEWKRITGQELAGKTIGVLGMGRVGKEVARRALAFGMKPIGFDVYWDSDFADAHGVARCETCEEVLGQAQIVSLHLPLTDDTHHLIREQTIDRMQDGAMVINTARGGLIVEQDVARACREGKLAGYATDVLDQEPIQPPHPFQEIDNIIVTPHVGSRTTQSVQRQAMRATKNLVNFLTGDDDYIQANKF